MNAFSWFVLGLLFGIGYCLLTDVHWGIKHKLGQYGLPRSYIKYLVDEWTGLDVPAEVVNTGGGILFFGALVLSIYLNIQDRIKNN